MKHLRRKLTLRAHGEQVVFVKHKQERIEHVWMKAFLWALYLPRYPEVSVEVSVGDKYKPDVVQMDRLRRRPVFWGEAGQVGADKIEALVRRYPSAHFAMCKWDASLDPFVKQVEAAVHGVDRSGAFDLLSIPADAPDRFIDAKGGVSLTLDDLKWVRIGNSVSLD
jgi:hypothetical protein